MPGLPSNYTTVQVRGRYVDLAGANVAGSIVFTPSVTSISDVGALTTIVGKPISVALSAGAFAVDLPATDDPDISPTGFTYLVEEKFSGFTGRTFSIMVPVAMAASGIELSSAAPVDTSTGTVRGYYLDELYDVNTAAAVIGALLAKQADGTWAGNTPADLGLSTTGRTAAFALFFGG